MTNYLNNVDSEWFNQRLSVVLMVILTAFVLLVGRLLYLQVIEGKEYRRLSEINSIRLQSVDAPRGLIYDRNQTLLVDNRPSFDLSITIKDAAPLDETLGKISGYTRIPLDVLTQKLEKNKNRVAYKPVLLKDDIGRDALAAIEVHSYDLPGVRVNVTPKRNYIFNKSAAHLLGYMGEIGLKELKSKAYEGCKVGDFIGRVGIEKIWEHRLRGKRGGRQVEVDARGRVVKVLKTVDAQPGGNIYLTIDHELQKEAENLLQDRAGAVVAVDPSNGEILVMAGSPSFDQNAFVSGLSHEQWNALVANPLKPMQNKPVAAEYPPASTFKIVTAIAALEEGVADVTTTVHCPGHYRFGNRTYRCWKKWGHGDVDIYKALSESCDVYFYMMGKELGVDRIAWYAKALGLGSETGIRIDNEKKGLVPTAAWKKKKTGVSWQKGETLSIAIGQGFNLATPLQMAMLTASVGNNGIRYKPVVVKSIKTAEGVVVFNSEYKVAGKAPVKKENLEIVKRGLWEAVNRKGGTAWASRIEGVDMCGKTGTAQVVGRKQKGDVGYDPEGKQEGPKDHAWFVAYAPCENPKIAVTVIVEHGEHGSSAAAPIASSLIKRYLEKTGAHPKINDKAIVPDTKKDM